MILLISTAIIIAFLAYVCSLVYNTIFWIYDEVKGNHGNP